MDADLKTHRKYLPIEAMLSAARHASSLKKTVKSDMPLVTEGDYLLAARRMLDEHLRDLGVGHG